MIWHIAKRELSNNLNSLRFALATVLLLGLMLTNAVVHLREHPERVQRYRERVSEHQNHIAAHASNSLYDLAARGDLATFTKNRPISVFVQRVAKRLCQIGHKQVTTVGVPVHSKAFGYSHTLLPRLIGIMCAQMLPKWIGGFIIGYVLSLVALLFTFDSISGERERGTLRLTLSNAIPRHTVLIGKFLGAFISVSIPFILAILVNLFGNFYVKCCSP